MGSFAAKPGRIEGTKRFHAGEAVFDGFLILAASLVLVTLAAILLILFEAGAHAFEKFGPAFVWTDVWNPVTDRYGALSAIVGTIATSLLALLIAWPLGFGIAYALTETCPKPLRGPIGVAVELLAAVPSIVYGMWGFFVLAPFLAANVQPWMTANAWIMWSILSVIGALILAGIVFSIFGVSLVSGLASLPIVAGLGFALYYFFTTRMDLPPLPSEDNPMWFWFSGAPVGVGLFTAGIVLSIMILPFIAAASRDVLRTTPQLLKDGGYAMGATRWEVMTGIVIPAVRGSLFGAVFLGLGRALGETMAVTFVIGNANRLPDSFFAPTASIASIVANEFPDADQGSLKLASLFALGFILFVVSFFVLALARLLLRQGRMA